MFSRKILEIVAMTLLAITRELKATEECRSVKQALKFRDPTGVVKQFPKTDNELSSCSNTCFDKKEEVREQVCALDGVEVSIEGQGMCCQRPKRRRGGGKELCKCLCNYKCITLEKVRQEFFSMNYKICMWHETYPNKTVTLDVENRLRSLLNCKTAGLYFINVKVMRCSPTIGFCLQCFAPQCVNRTDFISHCEENKINLGNS